MTAITFDGLKFVQTLQEGGFDETQAKSVARAFKDAQQEAEVATKADITRLEHLIAQTAAETRAEIIKWVSGIALAQVFLLAGILAKLVFGD